MPRWTPGLNQNGEPRSCRYQLVIDESVFFDNPADAVRR